MQGEALPSPLPHQACQAKSLILRLKSSGGVGESAKKA